jgi:DNA mismatch endonuclease (patch repair protein)
MTSHTKAPSFKGLVPASRSSSEIKKRNRAKDTAQELQLRRLLWKRGLRFRKNLRTLPGKPDIAFSKYRLAVFCDGDFWHGRDWEALAGKLRTGTNPHYWIEKVRSNRERDFRNNGLLTELGWTVLRFWESDIRHSTEEIADLIAQKIGEIASRPKCP